MSDDGSQMSDDGSRLQRGFIDRQKEGLKYPSGNELQFGISV